MYAEERQQAMAELVTQRGRMSVLDLSREFDVTTETVRRDLSTLERLNLVRRVHGGAVSTEALTVIEAALHDRNSANTAQKARIAAAGVELLPPSGATLIFDAGTTTGRLAELLPRDHSFSVITHSVPIAARLAGSPHIELFMLPGRVRRTTHAAVGHETTTALDQIRADVAFLGSNGITVGHGFSTPHRAEAAAKAAIVRNARRVVVLADSTKLGIERSIRFAELSDVDLLVTDDGIADADREAFEQAGLEVSVV